MKRGLSPALSTSALPITRRTRLQFFNLKKNSVNLRTLGAP
jgi:hypothetical protein